MVLKTLLAILFIAAILGHLARLNIYVFDLSTDTIDSPRSARRYYYRFVLFSSLFALFLGFSPALSFGLILELQKVNPLVGTIVYVVFSALLALISLQLDMRLIRGLDARKIARASGSDHAPSPWKRSNWRW